MLKYKILASNIIYCCINHKPEILQRYFSILDDIFKKISLCENNKINIYNLLEGNVCISGVRPAVLN